MQAKSLLFTLVMILPVFSAASTAAAESNPEKVPQPAYSYSYPYAPIYRFEIDLDSGGKFEVNRHFIRFDVSRSVDQKLVVGVGLTYDYENRDFRGVSDIAGADPQYYQY